MPIGLTCQTSRGAGTRGGAKPAEGKNGHRQSVHFSSQTEEWETPQWLFDCLNHEFRFTLDPCATDANAKCAKHYTRLDDGLKQPWADEVVFMNPPYGVEIPRWMKRAHDASVHERATIVCLVPARTDTRWWHKYAMRHEVRFLAGRLRFGSSKTSAPFPSAIVVMRPQTFRLLAQETSGPRACGR
jgi:phage N-6-adenine-methyltransferase